jgi:hypothetical protein
MFEEIFNKEQLEYSTRRFPKTTRSSSKRAIECRAVFTRGRTD